MTQNNRKPRKHFTFHYYQFQFQFTKITILELKFILFLTMSIFQLINNVDENKEPITKLRAEFDIQNSTERDQV